MLKNKENKYKIIFLGTSSFPHGMAEVEKQTLIARALQEQGCKVTFVCKKSFNYSSDIPFKGAYKNIQYIYTSFSAKRLRNKILNQVLWIIGNILEKIYILSANFDFAIVNSRNYDEIKWYAKLVHLRKRKIFLTHVEDYRSMHPNPSRKMTKEIDDFENKTWFIIDGAFPISEELTKQIMSKNKHLPLLKIPVLVDLNEVNNAINVEPVTGPYFMFCGSSDYEATIRQIIKGFEMTNVDTKLLLVLNGSLKSMAQVKYLINSSTVEKQIILKTDLPKNQLWGYYKDATALLIPLNFNQRDKARFPHKIGEYCAVGRPIITCDWGEIPVYFRNNENAIILRNNDAKELRNALEVIENNPELREKLGQGTLKLARDHFDYKLYGAGILNFINQ